MLVSEDILTQGFALLPEMKYTSTENRKPFFSWGDKEELDRYIIESKSNNYPLIWLLPSKDVYNQVNGFLTKKVSLVLATLETRTELFNGQRLNLSYDQTLNPLVENVKYYLDNASNLLLTSDIDLFKHPNYSGATDKWDAIKMDFEIEINNNCLQSISWI